MARFAIVLMMLLSACSTTSTTSPGISVAPSAPGHLVWPQPPDLARVRHVMSFSNPVDIGYREKWSARLKNLIGGESFPGMLRPYAIAVSDQVTAVADPGLGAVHLFDHQKRTYRLLKAADGSELSSPVGVALGENRLFVADSALNRVFVLDLRLRLIREVGEFARPTGLAYDDQLKHLFVADTLAHNVSEFDNDGNLVRIIGKRGNANGQFNRPTHLAVSSNRLFVNDNMNFRVQVFDVSTGAHLASIGEHGNSTGYLAQPKGLALSFDDQVFIAESVSNIIQVFSSSGEFLLDFGGEGVAPGQFSFPAGLAIHNNLLYVADSGNRRIQVFEYSAEK